MEIVDLRSDTLTLPSPAMREYMFNAPVGDDVFEEDPSVNALEEKAAAVMGKDAALFTPSGTMANQLGLRILTRLGDEILIEESSHVFQFESGGPAIISGVMPRTLPGKRGLLEPQQIESAVRPPDNPHFSPTRAVFLENTHNCGGGSIYPLETISAIREIALKSGLLMHLDGARLFNASVASSVPVDQYAKHFDTVSFCLSKGLGAPVGSVLVSDQARIKEARRWRKVLGGGMRQAGFLAAAGIYALDHNVKRLAEDHENAAALAKGIDKINGVEVNIDDVETNIVIFKVTAANLSVQDFCLKMKEKGVMMLPFGPDLVRAVTHLEVGRDGIVLALKAMVEVLKS